MFVSYAQNFEDVMLFRALKHIEQGFYVDVGAQHPVTHSVTRAFYERGWRGINMDPVQRWFDLLSDDRPRDITLQVALGAEDGEQPFYEIADTGLSTTDRAIAEEHARNGYSSITTTVPVRRLDDVLREHAAGDIHFLKIDVEGAEAAVLEGMAFDTHRPWIVLVEATLPLSQKESFVAWQDGLLARGYDFVYADGLNRYFVAKEHPELKAAFKYPPNVFDDFVLASQVELQHRVSLEHENAVAHAEELIPLRSQHARVLAEVDVLQQQVKREHENAVAHAEELIPLRSQHALVLAEVGALQQQVKREHENAVAHANELIPLRSEHASALAEIERLNIDASTHEEQVAQLKADMDVQLRTSRKAASKQRDLLDRAIANSRRQELRLAFLENEAARSDVLARNLSQQLSTLQGSTSWLVTAPLRLAGRVARREITARQAVRSLVGKTMLRFGPRLYRYRVFRSVGKFVLKLSPDAEAKVRQTVGAIPPTAAKDTMTSTARLIFTTILRGR